MSKTTVLFICTGNTCRSPMAEGFANAIFEQKNIDAIAESAGLNADGSDVNPKSVSAAHTLYGIDISRHKSRQLTREDAEQADQIVTMTPEQALFLQQIFPHLTEKISSLTPTGIQDPFGGTEEDYVQCAKEIHTALLKRTEDGAWN